MKDPILMLIPALLLSFSSTGMDRAQADTMVAQAQRLYVAGSHEEALHLLEQVEFEFDSPALQLGLGNCYYRLGDVPHAILHYERGIRLAPGDEDLRANLELALTQTKDRIPGDADHVVARNWEAFKAGSDPDQWARRSLWSAAALFALLILAGLLHGAAARRLAYGASAVAALLLLASLGFSIARDRRLRAHDQAIIVSPKSDVRAEPRDQAKVLFLLHKGTKVDVRDTANGWCEVSIASGATGWVPAAVIERI